MSISNTLQVNTITRTFTTLLGLLIMAVTATRYPDQPEGRNAPLDDFITTIFMPDLGGNAQTSVPNPSAHTQNYAPPTANQPRATDELMASLAASAKALVDQLNSTGQSNSAAPTRNTRDIRERLIADDYVKALNQMLLNGNAARCNQCCTCKIANSRGVTVFCGVKTVAAIERMLDHYSSHTNPNRPQTIPTAASPLSNLASQLIGEHCSIGIKSDFVKRFMSLGPEDDDLKVCLLVLMDFFIHGMCNRPTCSFCCSLFSQDGFGIYRAARVFLSQIKDLSKAPQQPASNNFLLRDINFRELKTTLEGFFFSLRSYGNETDDNNTYRTILKEMGFVPVIIQDANQYGFRNRNNPFGAAQYYYLPSFYNEMNMDIYNSPWFQQSILLDNNSFNSIQNLLAVNPLSTSLISQTQQPQQAVQITHTINTAANPLTTAHPTRVSKQTNLKQQEHLRTITIQGLVRAYANLGQQLNPRYATPQYTTPQQYNLAPQPYNLAPQQYNLAPQQYITTLPAQYATTTFAAPQQATLFSQVNPGHNSQLQRKVNLLPTRSTMLPPQPANTILAANASSKVFPTPNNLGNTAIPLCTMAGLNAAQPVGIPLVPITSQTNTPAIYGPTTNLITQRYA
ncbi:hypothetical protein NEHOM01_1869 [Nematocida homosporus]|uniref:uncharacterized protein n=1 Tax=Nematocida homosporus TaxID=1912981 RepID=UPI00222012DA|nr:uncharacterized protein NEHOM01_1869 [Nematocida homosporus]KAI5187017.1 hypothetical protein NEHOM01_1869 [Nematocida homosporus]